MSRQVRAVLEPRRLANLNRLGQLSGWVFGTEGHGFVRWSEAKDKLDARLNGTVAPYRLHDFRRSAATLMAERLGVLPHVLECVLNHVGGFRGGVQGIYNRATYATEMRDALDRWGEYVDRLQSSL
jgi:hypothetical protein